VRVRALILITAILALGACADSREPSERAENTGNSDTAGTTGYVNPEGNAYITNGSKEMETALHNDPSPVVPSPAKTMVPSQTVKPAPPTGNELRVRLKEFQISRFKLNEFKPSRFGDHRYKLTVFFRNEDPVEFNGPLVGANGKWTIKQTSGHYTLSGKFTDTVPLKIDGDLTLVDDKAKDSAHIIYAAYKTKLSVREDRTKKVIAGSVFEQQLKLLRDHTFGWAHNWMVVRGPAFYLVDIVKQVDDPAQAGSFAAPIIAFKGESLQTGDEDHPAESLTPTVSSNISLIGNSPTSRHRWFQAQFEDPQSKETNDVIIDVQAEREPKPKVGIGTPSPGGSSDLGEDPDDDDDTYDIPPDVPPQVQPPEPQAPVTPPVQPSQPVQPSNPPPQQPQQPAQPSPVQPRPPQPQPVQPLVPGTSYLKIDLSLPRTSRMSRDFARNRKIPGVVSWMNQYSNARDWHHNDLAAFYRNANPFRTIIETIGRAYDVSSSFAYLTVIESPYFTGGQYKISAETKSTAVGPFQLLQGTAQSLGMISSGANDERRYFAPSACGAARYIAGLVNEFYDSDTTVSILGYYQGDGGAARAIACTYADRSMCNGKNYSRYKQLSKSYNYSYAQIASVAAIPKDQLDYVNKKLAIYFISENISQYGFATGGVTHLPTNGTVFPSHQISDGLCRQTVSSMTGI
jgi:hypothetical protein